MQKKKRSHTCHRCIAWTTSREDETALVTDGSCQGTMASPRRCPRHLSDLLRQHQRSPSRRKIITTYGTVQRSVKQIPSLLGSLYVDVCRYASFIKFTASIASTIIRPCNQTPILERADRNAIANFDTAGATSYKIRVCARTSIKSALERAAHTRMAWFHVQAEEHFRSKHINIILCDERNNNACCRSIRFLQPPSCGWYLAIRNATTQPAPHHAPK